MTDARSYLINYVGDAYKEEKKKHTNAKIKIKINYMSYLIIHLYVSPTIYLHDLPTW